MDNLEPIIDLVKRQPLPPDEALPPGATEVELAGFEKRTGVVLPDDVRAFLSVYNGPCVGPGGLFGVKTERDSLDIENIYDLHPEWKQRGWLPIADDGCGNYYVVIPTRGLNAVAFVEIIETDDRPAYVAASSPALFYRLLLEKELGLADGWPFDEEETLRRDPQLAELSDLTLPWEA